jgi:cytochrome c2
MTIINFGASREATAENAQAEDAGRGKIIFQQNCALCHGVSQGPGNSVITGQGPSLIGILGRRAGASANFNYSKALGESRLIWDSATLDRFLANPMSAVPGTSMLVSIPAAGNCHDLIAYLATLIAPPGFSETINHTPLVLLC